MHFITQSFPFYIFSFALDLIQFRLSHTQLFIVNFGRLSVRLSSSELLVNDHNKVFKNNHIKYNERNNEYIQIVPIEMEPYISNRGSHEYSKFKTLNIFYRLLLTETCWDLFSQ